MKKFFPILAAVLVAAGSASAQVPANQAAVNKCAKTFEDTFQKTVGDVQKVYNICTQGLDKCFQQADPTKATACRTNLTTAGKNCSDAVLGLEGAQLDPKTGTKAGKFVGKAIDKIAKACNPALANVTNDPKKIDLAAALNVSTDGSSVGLGQKCSPGVTSASADWATVQACLTADLVAQIREAVQENNARAWFDLNNGGAPTTGIPLGTHRVTAGVYSVLTSAALGPIPLGSAGNSFEISVGAVDGTTGLAPISVDGTAATFNKINISNIATVCVAAPGAGEGNICCNPAGCPSAQKDYALSQDLNANQNIYTGGDPACQALATRTIGGVPVTSISCLMGPARTGACNATDVGSNNTTSAQPRCVGGDRNGRQCDPALADECPGGDCESAATASSTPPCVGPITASVSGDMANNDMVIQLPLRFTIGPSEVAPASAQVANGVTDLVPFSALYASAGCTNAAGDNVPDAFGCDGVACTADDLTPLGTTNPVHFTTGSAEAVIQDASDIDGNDVSTTFGVIGGDPPAFTPIGTAVTGTAPANGCGSLAASTTAGYILGGAFTGRDGAVVGDTATVVRLTLQ